jgi:diacylglycerol kinase (ATP)
MIEIRKLFKSFEHAFEGLEHAYRNDQNLRIHFFIAILVIIASIIFKVNPFEMGILGVMILLVMVSEMLNTAIERMVDLITKEHREDAKIAKDVAAGMVFLTATGSLIVGFLIFLPHILKLIK